jgi:hypothetical protein
MDESLGVAQKRSCEGGTPPRSIRRSAMPIVDSMSAIRTPYLVVLILVVAIAGGWYWYGHYGPGGKIDTTALKADISSTLSAKVGPVSSVDCVGNGRTHFDCLVNFADGDQLSVEVNCDGSSSGSCIWQTRRF